MASCLNLFILFRLPLCLTDLPNWELPDFVQIGFGALSTDDLYNIMQHGRSYMISFLVEELSFMHLNLCGI